MYGYSVMNSKQFKSGAKAFVEMGILKRGYVPQAEADNRAKVCASCAHNKTDRISLMLTIMEALVGKETKYDNALGVCDLCECVLPALVHASAHLVDTTHIEKYPQTCWKHTL